MIEAEAHARTPSLRLSLLTAAALLASSALASAAAPPKLTPAKPAEVRKLAKEAVACEVRHPVRCPALKTLVALGPSAVRPLTKLLRSRDAGERVVAATALGSLGEVASGPAVLKLLDDGEGEVRRAAMIAVGQLRPDGVVPALGRFLDSKEAADTAMAATALGMTASPAALEPLQRVLGHKQLRVRVAVVRALGQVGDASVVMELATLLARPDTTRPLSMAVSGALGRLKDKRAVPMLIIAATHPDPPIAHAAIQALGALGDDRAAGVLSLIVKDSAVAFEAASALGLIKSPGGLPGLLRVIKERKLPHKVIKRAFWAIGEIGAASAVPAVIPFLKDDDPVVSGYAAAALGRIGDKSALEPLLAALRREEKQAREMAAWGLQEITGETFGEDADRWEQWLLSSARLK